MRRLARRLFALCSAVSLVVFVAACAAWARSYWRGDIIEWRWHGQTATTFHTYRFAIHVGDGGVYGEWLHKTMTAEQAAIRRVSDYQRQRTERFQKSLHTATPPGGRRGWVPADAWGGFFFGRRHVTTPSAEGLHAVQSARACAPLWPAAPLLAAMPAGWLGRRWRARRSRRARDTGLCPSCAYDLRASPERCPECGAAAVSPS